MSGFPLGGAIPGAESPSPANLYMCTPSRKMTLTSDGCPAKAVLIAELRAAHLVALRLGNQESEHIVSGDVAAYAALEGVLKERERIGMPH